MSHEYNSYHLAPEAIPGFLVEVPVPESVRTRKIIPFALDGINYMIYEDNNALTHLDRDYREVEADGDMPPLDAA